MSQQSGLLGGWGEASGGNCCVPPDCQQLDYGTGGRSAGAITSRELSVSQTLSAVCMDAAVTAIPGRLDAGRRGGDASDPGLWTHLARPPTHGGRGHITGDPPVIPPLTNRTANNGVRASKRTGFTCRTHGSPGTSTCVSM